MRIPSYQIHNVLNTFSLQLINQLTIMRDADLNADSNLQQTSIQLSLDAKRSSVIAKVASDIVLRITSLDSLTIHLTPDHTVIPRSNLETNISRKSPETSSNYFEFVPYTAAKKI